MDYNHHHQLQFNDERQEGSCWHREVRSLAQVIPAASGRSRIQTQVFPLQSQYYLLTSIGYYRYALLYPYSSH